MKKMKEALSLYEKMNEKTQKILTSVEDKEIIRTLKEMNDKLDQYIYRKYKPCKKCGMPVIREGQECKEGNCEKSLAGYDWEGYYKKS